MTVKDAIKYLKRDYKPTDEIVMAWWDRKEFWVADGMTNDEWAEACEIAEGIDWSNAHDKMTYAIQEQMEVSDDS